MNCINHPKRPVINKKHSLCLECNSIRLHDKSQQERNIESQQKYQQNYINRFKAKVAKESDQFIERDFQFSLKKKSKFIQQQTLKEAGIKSRLSKLKKEIEMDAVLNNEYFCKGCGKAYCGLDCSHILSVGMYKQFELEKKNIQLLCRHCHEIWEGRDVIDMIKLNCYWENLTIIYELEPQAFFKEITKLEEYIKWQLDEQRNVLNAKKTKVLSLIKDQEGG